jgi:metacaspase-1
MADSALLIGINSYANIGDLNGCLNDVTNIKRLLVERFAFEAANITALEDDKAIKRTIVQTWRRLAKAAKAGDRLVFHFSGHGTAIRSDDDDEDQDELICLHNMAFGDPTTYLTDDDLAAMTREVGKGVHLTIILDNCHSGTGTRELFIAESARSFGAEHPVLPRYVVPPKQWQPRIGARGARSRSRLVEAVRKAAEEKDLNHLLLAGAMDTQTAADAFIAGAYNGAFTYYFCDSARTAGGQGSAFEIFSSAKSRIATERYTQVPQCEGPSELKSAPLFGKAVASASPPRQKPSPADPTAIGSSARPQPQALAGAPYQSGPLDTAGLRELIAVHGRFLDIVARSTGGKLPSKSQVMQLGPLALTRAPTGDIVYVHGIGPKKHGYSNAWFDAVSPHLGGGFRPVEVFWADIVNSRDARVDEAKVRMIRAQLEAVQLERAAAVMRDGGRDLERELMTRGARGPLDLLFSLDDFPRYLASAEIRDAVIGRFIDEVAPRLSAGDAIDIISHSWGTVVAYEGLVRLEAQGMTGRVRNFFTVGSALAWAVIRSQLEDAARDGHRPDMVGNWININAQGDYVGGALGSFAVTHNELFEPAVGCGFLSLPTCPHSSYFNAENLSVNRDLFAGRILS